MTPDKKKVIDVTITSFSRPYALRDMLRSLRSQELYQNDAYQIRVFLFQNGALSASGEQLIDPELVQQAIGFFSELFPDGKVLHSPVNLGLHGNQDRSFRHTRESDADYFFMFDDDLLLSPFYLSSIQKIVERTEGNPWIGFVSGIGTPGFASLELQKVNARRMIPMHHKWCLAFSRSTARKIGPFLEQYFTVSLSGGYRDDGNDGHHAQNGTYNYFKRLGWPYVTRKGVGSDAAIDLFSSYFLWYNISTAVCLAKTVGETGVHFNPTVFQRLGLDRMELFDGPVEDCDLPTEDESLRQVCLAAREVFVARLNEVLAELSSEGEAWSALGNERDALLARRAQLEAELDEARRNNLQLTSKSKFLSSLSDVVGLRPRNGRSE